MQFDGIRATCPESHLWVRSLVFYTSTVHHIVLKQHPNLWTASASSNIHLNASGSVRMVNIWPYNYERDNKKTKPQPDTVDMLCWGSAIASSESLTKTWVAILSCFVVLTSTHNLFSHHMHPYKRSVVLCSVVRRVLVLIPTCSVGLLVCRSPPA